MRRPGWGAAATIVVVLVLWAVIAVVIARANPPTPTNPIGAGVPHRCKPHTGRHCNRHRHDHAGPHIGQPQFCDPSGCTIGAPR
jgi:hypothetical protein